MKNFDEMLPKDRELTVGGETFHWRDARPEALSLFEPQPDKEVAEDATDAEKAEAQAWNATSQWRLMDDQILMFLVPDEHDKWTELRARTDNPVTIAQLNAILLWLMEQQTDRPTVTPSPSAPGRGRTAATSKDG